MEDLTAETVLKRTFDHLDKILDEINQEDKQRLREQVTATESCGKNKKRTGKF